MADALTGRVMVVEVGRPGPSALRIESREPEPLPIRVTVRRSEGSSLDRAEVEIDGAGASLLGRVSEPGAVCRVLAGYEAGGPVEVIAGAVVPGSVRSPRVGSARRVSWLIQEAALETQGRSLSRSWSRSITADEVLAWAAGAVGLGVSGRLASPVAYARGYVVSGTLGELLRDLARDTGSVVRVRDGQIVAYPVGGGEPLSGPLLTPESGLINEPEMAEDGATVTSLLLPGMRPGRRFVVAGTARPGALDLDGEYVAVDVMHIAATTGRDFYTRIDGLRVSSARAALPAAVATSTPSPAPPRPTLAEAMTRTAERAAGRVEVAAVARVSRVVGPAEVEVVPLVSGAIEQRDGSIETVEAPPVRVPVGWPQGGGYSDTWPLSAGATVLLVVRDRSHDEVDAGRVTGRVQPRSRRRYNLADAVALPVYGPPGALPASAARSDGRVVAMPGGAGTHFGSASAETRLVTWDVLEAFWGAVQNFYGGHIHLNAAGPTGPPNLPLPDIPEVMATGRVLVDDIGPYTPPPVPDPPPDPPDPEDEEEE